MDISRWFGFTKDYYVDNDEKTIEIRKKYTAHISKMLQFINFPADYAILQLREY